VDPGQLPAAKPVLQAFTGAYSRSDDYGYFTLPAYDAASILIEAMGRAITSAGGKLPTRDQVRAEVAKTKNHRGALGLTSFDVNGDTSLRTLAVYASKGKPSDWKFVAHVATAPD
jgi:ABC-type branched-subunit amino acid transport system substrate-binding protein